jgi:hypothetical protein
LSLRQERATGYLTRRTPTLILTLSLSCSIFGYEEAGHRLIHQRTTHLRVSRDDTTGFARDAYAAQGPFFHGAGHCTHQLFERSEGDLTPEALLQSRRFEGLLDAWALGTHIYPTPGQLSMDIRQDLSSRTTNQSYQLIFCLYLLTPHAGALGRSLDR